MLELYMLPLCPFVQRARLGLYKKKLNHKVNIVDVTKPRSEFLMKVNNGKAPVLIDEQGHPIIESLLILEYLDEAYPDRPSIFPKDAHDKYLSKLIVSEADKSYVSVMYELLLNQDRSKDQDIINKALDGHRKLNNWFLQTNPHGKFAFGDDMTYVDLALVPFTQRYVLNKHYRKFEIPRTKEFERFHIWRDAVLQHELSLATANTDEEIIKFYEDYSLGYSNGKIVPGKTRSSFADSVIPDFTVTFDESGPIKIN